MQRAGSTTSRDVEHYVIEIPDQPLPTVNHHHHIPPRRPIRSPEKWVHAVPLLLVLLCFFLLWWFSYPASLVSNNGRIKAHPINMPNSLNETDTDVERLAILAVVTSRNPSIQLSPVMVNNTGDTYL